jgi:hypothetical protein
VIRGICLSGKKYSGKDKVFEHIAQVVADRKVIRHKWATTLRQEAVKMLSGLGIHVSVEDLEDRIKKEPYVGLLQWLGTDFRRRQDPDYWVKRGMAMAEQELRWADRVREAPPLFVNTDTRFPNEVTVPQANGWIAIRLEVGHDKQLERAAKVGAKVADHEWVHASETALDEMEERTRLVRDGIFANSESLPVFDYLIDSNNDLEIVLQEVEGILAKNEIKLRPIR